MTLEKLGRYDIVKPIGKWAMGLVYEAHDPNIARHVAIKTIRVDHLSDALAAKYESRFRSETQAGGRLQHPNIIGVYDAGRDQGLAFVVMEMVRGGDVRKELSHGKHLSFDRSMGIMKDLLSALNFAHEQGIVHRSVRPANLLLDLNGRVKLGDFGVAQFSDADAGTRTRGSKVGALNGLAPEQVNGQDADTRADLFAAGVVLYELLTAAKPFDGKRDVDIMNAITQHDPPPPSTLNLGLPAGIDAVIAKVLAKNRDHRYASAKEFALALRDLTRNAAAHGAVASAALNAPPAPATPAPPRPPRAASSTAGDASAPSQGSGSNRASVSAVSQEMELLYWKDIQDSVDPDDFLGFLRQFPVGVYAGLAQRRVRRLATVAPDASGSGTTPEQPGATPPSARHDEAVAPPSPPSPIRTPHQTMPPPDQTAEATLLAPRSASNVDTSSAERAAREAAVRRAAEEDARRQVEDARRRVQHAQAALVAEQARQAKAAEEARQARLAEDMNRAAEERKAREAEAAERLHQAEEERAAAHARKAEKTRLAELERATREAQQAEERRRAEEAQRIEEQRKAREAKAAEQARRAEEVRRAAQALEATRAQLAEQERAARAAQEAEQRQRAEAARQAEEQRKAREAEAAEQARRAEEERLAAQAREAERERQAEQERAARAALAAEERRCAEAARQVEEQRKAKEAEAEKARIAAQMAEREQGAEAARQAETMRLAESARVAQARQVEKTLAEQQARQAEEAQRLVEEARRAEQEDIAKRAREAKAERAAKQAREAEKKREAEAEAVRQADVQRSEQARLAVQAKEAQAAALARIAEESKAETLNRAKREETERPANQAQRTTEPVWTEVPQTALSLPSAPAPEELTALFSEAVDDDATRLLPAHGGASAALRFQFDASQRSAANEPALIDEPQWIAKLASEPEPVSATAAARASAVPMLERKANPSRLIAITAAVVALGSGGAWLAIRNGDKTPLEATSAPGPAEPVVAQTNTQAMTPQVDPAPALPQADPAPSSATPPAPAPAPSPAPEPKPEPEPEPAPSRAAEPAIQPRPVPPKPAPIAIAAKPDVTLTAPLPHTGPSFEWAKSLERSDLNVAIPVYQKIATNAGTTAAAQAARRLWEIYRSGGKGVASNPGEAQRWYDRAQALGATLPAWTPAPAAQTVQTVQTVPTPPPAAPVPAYTPTPAPAPNVIPTPPSPSRVASPAMAPLPSLVTAPPAASPNAAGISAAPPPPAAVREIPPPPPPPPPPGRSTPGG